MGLELRPPHINHSERAFSLAWAGGQAVLWMGLGWVRDLRRDSVRAIVKERKRRRFASLRDLAIRVPLQSKELAHLIQCGALDGLGACRAAMLAESKTLQSSGHALQLSFEFGLPQVDTESWAQCLDWERQLLGYPVSGFREPLKLAARQLPDHTRLSQLPETRQQSVTTAGVRLPGWTGGKGFYLWDGETWVIVRGDVKAPSFWEPVLLRGRWVARPWELAWFQAQAISIL